MTDPEKPVQSLDELTKEQLAEIQLKLTLEKYRNITTDPNYCGLGEANTGPNDPWYKFSPLCKQHDPHYQKLIDRKGDDGAWLTFGEFAKNIVVGMAQGARMVLTGPIYLIIGGIGGLFRFQQLERQNGYVEEKDDDVLGDDV